MAGTLTFAGRQVEYEQPDAEENGIIEATVRDMLVGQCDTLQRLFLSKINLEAIKLAAGVCKSKLNGAKVRGQIAGDNEIAMQLIRPGHILRTTGTTETPTNTWETTLTSGNQNWIGYSTTHATAVNISQFIVVLTFGLMFTQGGGATIEEIFPQIGNTSYPGIVTRHAWIADNNPKVRIAAFHPMLIEARQTTLWTINALINSVQELVLLGVTFGYGRYLRKTTYAAADLP